MYFNASPVSKVFYALTNFIGGGLNIFSLICRPGVAEETPAAVRRSGKQRKQQQELCGGYCVVSREKQQQSRQRNSGRVHIIPPLIFGILANKIIFAT